MNRKIVVGDGKYVFETHDGDYRVFVLRYGNPWLVIEAGSNALALLMDEFLELAQRLEEREP